MMSARREAVDHLPFCHSSRDFPYSSVCQLCADSHSSAMEPGREVVLETERSGYIETDTDSGTDLADEQMEQKNNEVGWNDLPKELHLLILSNLDSRSLLRLQHMNRLFSVSHP